MHHRLVLYPYCHHHAQHDSNHVLPAAWLCLSLLPLPLGLCKGELAKEGTKQHPHQHPQTPHLVIAVGYARQHLPLLLVGVLPQQPQRDIAVRSKHHLVKLLRALRSRHQDALVPPHHTQHRRGGAHVRQLCAPPARRVVECGGEPRRGGTRQAGVG